MNCAWCERPTSELLVPGARGGWVHRSCEASRRGRRWFLRAAAVLAGAAAAAPVLDLVPDEGPVATLVDFDLEGPARTASGYMMEQEQAIGRMQIEFRKAREFFKGNQYLWWDGTTETWKGAT